MSEILSNHREIWNRKKILRVIYNGWYKMILNDMSSTGGKNIELGAGSGNFKEFKPDVISADIEPCGWLDLCFDAHKMPFDDSSVSNIVMIDVLHHLSNPVLFMKEAYRVLEKSGRLIILEPYPSLFSLMVYRKFHPEPFIFDVNYYEKNDNVEQKDPWDSNQAIAFLLFYKKINEFSLQFENKFKILKKKRMSCILYPVSGGFEIKHLSLIFSYLCFVFLEIIFIPFRRWFAFRTYLVIEKL